MREHAGVTVRLLWDAGSGEVWLTYADRRGDAFTTTVPPARAMEAFRHPNIFRTQHDRQPASLEPVAHDEPVRVPHDTQ